MIDQEKCVQCYLRLRSGICPVDAFEKVRLTWPKIVDHPFSSAHGARLFC